MAIIGAGGIAFDLSEYLLHSDESSAMNLNLWLKEWGIDTSIKSRGGIEGIKPVIHPGEREIFYAQAQ